MIPSLVLALLWLCDRLVLMRARARTATAMRALVEDSVTRARAAVVAHSETNHRRLIEHLANAIPTLAWTARADGYIDWYNARWYEYTGTTPADMEGWGWQSVHDPDMLPIVLERWRASIAKGFPFEMTFPLRGRDGHFRQFLTRVVPTFDADGAVGRWFGTNTDVHDALKAAAALDLLAGRHPLPEDSR